MHSDFVYRPFTFYGATFQVLRLSLYNPMLQSYNPNSRSRWFGLFPFRSPLLRESRLISLPQGTEMFHFPWSRFYALFNSNADILLMQDGFPHSEISGSKCICHSPKLNAAYHVLHRLSIPRHSPYALISLINQTFLRSHHETIIVVDLFCRNSIQLSKNRLPNELEEQVVQGGDVVCRTGQFRAGSLCGEW